MRLVSSFLGQAVQGVPIKKQSPRKYSVFQRVSHRFEPNFQNLYVSSLDFKSSIFQVNMQIHIECIHEKQIKLYTAFQQWLKHFTDEC